MIHVVHGAGQSSVFNADCNLAVLLYAIQKQLSPGIGPFTPPSPLIIDLSDHTGQAMGLSLGRDKERTQASSVLQDRAPYLLVRVLTHAQADRENEEREKMEAAAAAAAAAAAGAAPLTATSAGSQPKSPKEKAKPKPAAAATAAAAAGGQSAKKKAGANAPAGLEEYVFAPLYSLPQNFEFPGLIPGTKKDKKDKGKGKGKEKPKSPWA